MKRLLKNRVATISLIIILLITLSSIFIPMFWPYSYDSMLGVRPGKPVDASFNNLAPMTYGRTELQRIEAGEQVSRIFSERILLVEIILFVLYMEPEYLWRLVFLPVLSF